MHQPRLKPQRMAPLLRRCPTCALWLALSEYDRDPRRPGHAERVCRKCSQVLLRELIGAMPA